MSQHEIDLKHLEWAIASRAKNQHSALQLLGLFEKYEKKWKTKDYSRAAQELIGITFSLWRAAFLANKSSHREDVFAHGRKFLGLVVEDNFISFPQDKGSRNWTFNYYTRNARLSLRQLARTEKWKGIVPSYEDGNRNPTERWDYCQQLLSTAVEAFGQHLAKLEVEATAKEERRKARADKRRKRNIVRQLTIANRK